LAKKPGIVVINTHYKIKKTVKDNSSLAIVIPQKRHHEIAGTPGMRESISIKQMSKSNRVSRNNS